MYGESEKKKGKYRKKERKREGKDTEKVEKKGETNKKKKALLCWYWEVTDNCMHTVKTHQKNYSDFSGSVQKGGKYSC